MAKKQAEKVKEITIDDKIRDFVTRMKAKRSPFATDEEGKEMYALYNEKFKMQLNWQIDKSCSICVSRTFKDLEKYIKKLDKNGK